MQTVLRRAVPQIADSSRSLLRAPQARKACVPRRLLADDSSHWYDVPIRATQHVFDQVQHTVAEPLGMQWWATLALCACALRLSVLPFNVYAMRHAKLIRQVQMDSRQLKDILDKISLPERLEDAEKKKIVENLGREASGRFRLSNRKLYPWHLFVYLPLFATCALSIRDMGLSGHKGWSTGGFGWIRDLTSTDPYLILPIANCALMLLNTQLMLSSQASPEAISQWLKDQSTRKNPLQILGALMSHPSVADWLKLLLQMYALLIAPLLAVLPAGVVVFWTSSSLCGVVLQVYLRRTSERARKESEQAQAWDLVKQHSDVRASLPSHSASPLGQLLRQIAVLEHNTLMGLHRCTARLDEEKLSAALQPKESFRVMQEELERMRREDILTMDMKIAVEKKPSRAVVHVLPPQSERRKLLDELRKYAH